MSLIKRFPVCCSFLLRWAKTLTFYSMVGSPQESPPTKRKRFTTAKDRLDHFQKNYTWDKNDPKEKAESTTETTTAKEPVVLESKGAPDAEASATETVMEVEE